MLSRNICLRIKNSTKFSCFKTKSLEILHRTKAQKMGNNTGILGGILGDNLPYTENNPFMVEFTDGAIIKFMAGALVMTIAGLVIAHFFGKWARG